GEAVRRRAPLWMGAALAGVVLGNGCKPGTDPEPAPAPGTFTVNLTTPNSDDGALLVRITGTGGETVTDVVTTCSGCKLFKAVVSGTEVRGVITGTISAGAVATVTVSDTNKKGSYSVTILDVASRTYVKRALTGYGLALQ
ncbi:MAG TPA: hypothetical protein VD793_02000, partial [Gemmatimonadales bacterium]|nr:hypothetical protein [Gemmatimonadales bacterium]